MMSERDAVITAFYDAALGTASWETALGLATTYLGAHAATFSSHDPVTRRSRLSIGELGTDKAYSDSFATTYSAISPFALAAILAKVGEATKPLDLVGRDEVVKSRFFTEWCRPQSYHDFIGAIVARQPDLLHAIAFVRLNHQPMFDADDLSRLQGLIPHITRAVTVADRVMTLETERRDVFAAIDQLPIALLIVDGKRRIKQANQAASVMLASGMHITSAHGIAALIDDAAGEQFRSAFHADGIMPLTLILPGTPPLQLSLLPQTSNRAGRDSARAFIFLHPQQILLPAAGEALKARFGFTTAELRVLMMLMEGGTRSQIATNLGVSIETVKTQLQGLFRKTGTSRQADLVRQIMGALGPPPGA
jgi:DNA-binding CsgD family transcriptional regulator